LDPAAVSPNSVEGLPFLPSFLYHAIQFVINYSSSLPIYLFVQIEWRVFVGFLAMMREVFE
jgi:hypothetical protein